MLYVAIPTLLRDFHTTLPSLQWVITGYVLTFATLLIIGGRLVDVYGHRRIFLIGLALFGAGSLLASRSTSVSELVLGEAIIEGIGAALMMPASTAIISSTFRGRERGTAFAMWATASGVGAAFGPVIGGFLTTNYSWRWAFLINVFVAPGAIVAALVFMRRSYRGERTLGIDIPGAVLVAFSMFLLVFGLSEGGTYGWMRPKASFLVGGAVILPRSSAISIVPIAFMTAAGALVMFVLHERAKERRGEHPLFEFSLLRTGTIRWGLLATSALFMGQWGVVFVLPTFLQAGRHLTAEQSGFWLLPHGLFVILGARLGSRLIHRFGTTMVVRLGLAMEAAGIVGVALALRPDVQLAGLLPGLALYSIGVAFAVPQLTNLILEHVPRAKSGVIGGVNATVRQVSAALGVAVISAILTAQTVHHAAGSVEQSSLSGSVKLDALSRFRALGTNFAPPHGASAHEVATLRDIFERALSSGARDALGFAIVVVTIGALIALRIPRFKPSPDVSPT